MHETMHASAAEEVVRLYNDVLRTGSLVIDGEAVRWDTNTTTELQLRNFCDVFWRRLRGIDKLSSLDWDTLQETAYWFCKAVSVSYLPMVELLREVGATSIGKASEEAGVDLMQYSLDVTNDIEPALLATMRWKGSGGSLMTVNLTSGDKEVKGQLRQLQTSFPVPVGRSYRPTYEFDLHFPAPAASKGFFSKLLGARRRARTQGDAVFSDKDRRMQGGQTTVHLLADSRLYAERAVSTLNAIPSNAIPGSPAGFQDGGDLAQPPGQTPLPDSTDEEQEERRPAASKGPSVESSRQAAVVLPGSSRRLSAIAALSKYPGRRASRIAVLRAIRFSRRLRHWRKHHPRGLRTMAALAAASPEECLSASSSLPQDQAELKPPEAGNGRLAWAEAAM
mmetsp:Transcript_20790/g.37871  ORF Transcript_20790/g.37871 Transcript_20790/m.37871 type:complete len:393 (-) Transcript_20790:52-1230(-)